MKTLRNNIILYDSNCPLCKAYTGAFVNCGLLDANGRSPYNQKDPALFAHIDETRARNEIALVDLNSNTVLYGMDSLIQVLGHQRPGIKTILKFPLVYYPARFFYSLVSYNRKMIAPSKTRNDDCIPDFNLFYRLLFLLLTAVFTAMVLYRFISPVLQFNHLDTGLTQELLVVTGQIGFQSTVLLALKQKNIFQYLGNMMTVSAIGALLLVPAILYFQFAGFNLYAALAWFAGVVGFMFLLHLKRCKKLGLGLGISLSWVFYRILVLILIFSL